MSEMRRRLLMTIANGGGGEAKFASGSVTIPSGTTEPVTIEHGLGVSPNCIFYLTPSTSEGSTAYCKCGWHFDGFLDYTNANNAKVESAYKNTFRGGSLNVVTITNIDEDFFDINPVGNGFLPGGCTFYWFALYVDTTS